MTRLCTGDELVVIGALMSKFSKRIFRTQRSLASVLAFVLLLSGCANKEWNQTQITNAVPASKLEAILVARVLRVGTTGDLNECTSCTNYRGETI